MSKEIKLNKSLKCSSDSIIKECPLCKAKPKDQKDWPQNGTHIFTVPYECGTEIDYLIGGEEAEYGVSCDGTFKKENLKKEKKKLIKNKIENLIKNLNPLKNIKHPYYDLFMTFDPENYNQEEQKIVSYVANNYVWKVLYQPKLFMIGIRFEQFNFQYNSIKQICKQKCLIPIKFMGSEKIIKKYKIFEKDFDGSFYPSSLHLYLSLKCDDEQYKKIISTTDVNEVKEKSKDLLYYNYSQKENWKEIKEEALKLSIYLKFEQNKNLLKILGTFKPIVLKNKKIALITEGVRLAFLNYDNQIKTINCYLFKRYMIILKTLKKEIEFKEEYDFLKKAILEVENMTIDKHSRWLGYIQGILIIKGVLDINEERNYSRHLFQYIYKSNGILQKTIE